MKLHIVANRAPWVSWEEKINAIKLFFSPAFHFDVEIEHTDYEIPLIPSPDFPSLYEVDRTWYDANIANRNADIVLLVLDRNSLEVVTPFGLTQGHFVKGMECTVYANEKDRLYVGGKDIGNSFVRWAQHELSHALYRIYGLPDKTHDHFYAGEPDKVVPDFIITDPRFPILLKLRLAYWTAISYFKSLPKERVVDDAPTYPLIANVQLNGHSPAWCGGTLEERKEMFRLAKKVCAEEGLSDSLTRDVLLTIAGESGFNPWCVNLQSLDYGIAQFSIKYYLPEYKMTPQDAIDQPERCLRIMCRNFKAGRQSNWVAFQNRFSHANMLIKLTDTL